jgi:hypothetical protein
MVTSSEIECSQRWAKLQRVDGSSTSYCDLAFRSLVGPDPQLNTTNTTLKRGQEKVHDFDYEVVGAFR